MGLGVVMQWKGKVIAAVKADPKKAGVLAVLVLVMAGLWLRYALSSSPESAAASVAADPAAAAPADNKAAARTPEWQLVEQWAHGPISPLSRNLFAVNYDAFPDDGSARSRNDGSGDGFWGQLQKSLDARADQREKRRQEVDSLRSVAGQLHLQSVIMGRLPKALVNDQLVAVGDVVSVSGTDFYVVKIDRTGIVVQRGGIKLEISFN